MSTGSRLAAILLFSTALTNPVVAQAQDTSTGSAVGESGTTPDAAAQQAESERTNDTASRNQPEISVPGGEIVVVGRRNRDVTRSSTQVVSVLDSEAIARTGEGDIAGALSRVTGLSVVGNGRVYVRGLGDRYSLALLNGLPLPSPEPLSRVVPLDIFPTDVIASSLVQKSYSANFPGEFGGGVINLTTVSVPTETFLRISGGVSGDTITSLGKGLTYFGSKLDWLGYDNGNRDVPSNILAYMASGERIQDTSNEIQEGIAAQLMPTNLVTLQKDNEIPVNFSADITGGTAIDLGGDTTLGIIATAGIKNNWRNRYVHSQTGNTDLTGINSDFNTFITDNTVLVNGLLGLALDFGRNKIRWTNLYIHDTLKTARLGIGTDYTLGTQGFDFANQNTAFYERQLIDSQLVGEFHFGDLGLDLRGGYAQTDRKAPYNANISYTKTHIGPYGEQYVAYLNQASDVGQSDVAFDDLTEKQWYGGADLSYNILSNMRATVGYAYTDTNRYSMRRDFFVIASGDVLDGTLVPAIGLRPPGDIINGASLAGFQFNVFEASDFPAFAASLQIHAGYGMIRYNPIDPVTIDLGVRYEHSKQNVDLDQSIFNNPVSGAIPTSINSDYWLPSGTVTWEVSDRLQLRASASKTLARPQFRELVEQIYFDPESNRPYRGNPLLQNSELYNAELRAEYYLTTRNRLSLSGFFKKIDNPIESFITNESRTLVTSYANAPEAILYGSEFELQHTFDLSSWGGFFGTKELLAIANYTYSHSELKVDSSDTTLIPRIGETPANLYFKDGDPLTGQSNHVGNFQLSLQDVDKLQQFTVLVKYASERSVSRGFQRPDIIENPGITIDLVARQGFTVAGKEFEIKGEVRNLLGRGHQEYQELNGNRIDFNAYAKGTIIAGTLSVKL